MCFFSSNVDSILTVLILRQNDFRLMCTNAMAYNRSDTIYFKAGKRLLHMGTKVMHGAGDGTLQRGSHHSFAAAPGRVTAVRDSEC